MGLFSGPDVEALKQQRDFDGLAEALAHRKADIRDQAVAAIAELASAEAVRPIMAVTAGGKPATLDAAAAALHTLGQPALDGLMAEVERDDPPGQALRASAALGYVDPQLALPVLSEMSESEDAMRRVYATGGLGALVGKEANADAIELLGRLLKEDDEFVVRMTAAGKMGLGASSDPQARVLLNDAAVNDPDENVRSVAGSSL